LLKQGRFEALDIGHLVEELENMGRRDRQEVGQSPEDTTGPSAQLKILLGHLLKWQHQPTHRSSSYLGSILEQRLRIRDLLQDSPSLQPYLAEAMGKAYADGARLASKETGLPLGHFPEGLPYRLDHLLDDDWLPEDR
jgi:hypothetical protein